MDHTLANIAQLERLNHEGVRGILIHASNRIQFVSGPGSLKLERGKYGYVSLLPISSKVTGIHLVGLLYLLDMGVLQRGDTRGLSNQFVADKAYIHIEQGECLVIESNDPMDE